MITEIPIEIRNRYKTAFELSQKVLIDQSADRAPFVDQTQSLNLWFEHPTNSKLSTAHMYGWKQGLKTGSYYIRSKPARSQIKFAIKSVKTPKVICTEDVCTMCSS